jgi:hypothetical protein
MFAGIVQCIANPIPIALAGTICANIGPAMKDPAERPHPSQQELVWFALPVQPSPSRAGLPGTSSRNAIRFGFGVEGEAWRDGCHNRFGRLVNDEYSAMRYWWNKATKQSRWEVSPEIALATPEKPASVLCLTSDKGSTLWSVFMFLSNMKGALCRIMFHRDPNHRMSNIFGTGTRFVPTAMKTVLNIMLVHRFRRAPSGGCRFWQERDEMLSVEDVVDVNVCM